MILSAQSIRARVGMITPFVERSVQRGMSFGLSSCGYDIRIAETIGLVPGMFTLASTVERFDIPNDVAMFVVDKSTWARRGIAVQNTVAEPGWRGFLTLELTNHSDEPVFLYSGDPIAQAVFHRLDMPTEYPYAPNAKYQDQARGPQPALFERDGADEYAAGIEALRQEWIIETRGEIPVEQWIKQTGRNFGSNRV